MVAEAAAHALLNEGGLVSQLSSCKDISLRSLCERRGEAKSKHGAEAQARAVREVVAALERRERAVEDRFRAEEVATEIAAGFDFGFHDIRIRIRIISRQFARGV